MFRTSLLIFATGFFVMTTPAIGHADEQGATFSPEAEVTLIQSTEPCFHCGSAVATGVAPCQTCNKRSCCCECNPKDYICCPTTSKETVEKNCYVVKCEPKCIPAFKWPWECCCKPKCGRVRCVKVLEEESYECEECVTEWNVKRVRRCRCPAGRCSCGAGNKCCGLQQPLSHVAEPEKIQQAAAEIPAPEAKQKQARENFWSKLLLWRK